MPSYAKLIKEILLNTRKQKEHETVTMSKECNVAIQSMLPAKLNDLGNFSSLCFIANVYVDLALCGLGSGESLMPLSMSQKLDLKEIRSTTISLELANHSVKNPVGVLEDVPFKVGDLYVPVDFVVLEMEKNTCTLILLGRPFLATTKLSVDMGEDHLRFYLFKATKFYSTF